MRCAIAGFGIESSTFTPLKVQREDFIIRTTGFTPKGLSEYCTSVGIELVETMLVSGTPNGCVPRVLFDQLKKELLDRLRSSVPFEGLLLSMHGGMLLDDGAHGELEVLRAVRQEFGPDLPISVRLDLHGNIPDGFIDLVNCVTALRTAPHRDGLDTLIRATRLLKRIIDEGLRPVTYQERLPLLFPGEMVVTEHEPGRSLYAMIEEVEKNPSLLAASIMVGFAWADTPFTGASILTTSTGDRADAVLAARVLADRFMDLRREFHFDGDAITPTQAVATALAPRKSPLFLSDSGDNITAGAPGDAVSFLRQLIDAQVDNFLYAQIFDPEVVKACVQQGHGNEVTVSLGAHRAPWQDTPLQVSAFISRIVETERGRMVILKIAKGTVIVQEQRVPIADRKLFELLEIDLLQVNVAVFKLGYLMPDLREMCAHSALVLTPGPSALNVRDLPYSKLRRPIFPLDAL